MFDTHLHLVNEGYEDIKKVIDDAKNCGVLYLIHGGCSVGDNKSSIELSKCYDNLYVTVGYHPSECSSINDSDFDLLEKQILENGNKVIAIGEIGLDYHYGKEDRMLQLDLFRKQLDLAVKYKLPVVIHTRDAIMETYDILKEYKGKIRGVIHCFSGSLEMANKFIELGYLLGIGGVVCFSNSRLFEVVSAVSLDDIVLETDSPYLSPYRGEVNEPKNIKVIAEKIADIKGVSLEEVAKVTSRNAIGLFDLDIDL